MVVNNVKTEMIEQLSSVKTMYKYISIERGLELLKKSSIVFSNPLIFNDPYDCYDEIITHEKIPESFREDFVMKHFPNLNRKERRIMLKTANKVLTDTAIRKSSEDLIKQDKIQRAVTCFSKASDNLLMWSHYANSHNGLCIGFDLLKFYSHAKKWNYERLLIPVQYSYKIEFVDFYEAPRDAFLTWLRNKSNHWKYEKEIRMIISPVIFDDSYKIALPIDISSLVKVFIGCNVDPEKELNVINICKEKYPKVKVYKMELSKDCYKLIPKKAHNCN